MREDKTKYVCTGCKKPVMRITEGCNEASKQCARCVTQPRSVLTSNLALSLPKETKEPEVYDFYKENLDKIEWYEQILKIVIELNTKDVSLPFVSLWEHAKRRVDGNL